MKKHEATRGVAHGVAPQGVKLRGLPQEHSRKYYFVPKLSDLASAPRGHFFRFPRESCLDLRGE